MLINKKAVRKCALEMAKVNKFHKFTRVSNTFLWGCESSLHMYITDKIHELPSKGKTIK